MAILALDQGTSASKAAVLTGRGRVLGMARVPVRTCFGPGGEATQDPEEIVSSARRAIARAMREARSPRLEALGITSQRSTFVLWDRETGRALAPAPTWLSTSAADLCERWGRHAPYVRRVTGLPLSPHYSASKLSRLLSLRPEWRRRAARGKVLFGHVTTWLLWRLSDGSLHATDPTQAARSLLFDLLRLRWDQGLLDLFQVPRGMLPAIRPSLGDYGEVRVGGRTVPVTAMMGDQQAALAGTIGLAGAGRTGVALANYGTGAFVLAPTGRRLMRRQGLLSSVAWTRAGARRHLLEGTINAGGSALDWLREELDLPAGFSSLDRVCRTARGHPVFLPWFWGPGSAFMTPGDGRPPALMASPSGALPWGRPELAAATVESIAHAVALCVSRAGQAARVSRVIATGSLTRLRYLMEFQAALLDVPLYVARESEATLAGIAAAASGGRMGSAPTARVGRVVKPPQRAHREARRRHDSWLRLASVAREMSTVWP